jgi:hypothetical protein
VERSPSVNVTELPERITFNYVCQLNDKLVLKNQNVHKTLEIRFFSVENIPSDTRIGYTDRVETWMGSRRSVRGVEYREVFVERGAQNVFEWRKVDGNVEFRKDGMLSVMWMEIESGILKEIDV